jgi:hypothetical protein
MKKNKRKREGKLRTEKAKETKKPDRLLPASVLLWHDEIIAIVPHAALERLHRVGTRQALAADVGPCLLLAAAVPVMTACTFDKLQNNNSPRVSKPSLLLAYRNSQAFRNTNLCFDSSPATTTTIPSIHCTKKHRWCEVHTQGPLVP